MRMHNWKVMGRLFACAFAALATVVQAEPVHYTLDPNHTFVTFEIGHFDTSTNRARFDRNQGSVTLDRVAKTGSVALTIDTQSVNSGSAAFDKYLQSFEILDTASYPTASFVSDSFHFTGDQVDAVVGRLTLMGRANPVVLRALRFHCAVQPPLGREVCGGDFETTLDRVDWGINYGLIFGFSRWVHLVIQVEAIRQ